MDFPNVWLLGYVHLYLCGSDEQETIRIELLYIGHAQGRFRQVPFVNEMGRQVRRQMVKSRY